MLWTDGSCGGSHGGWAALVVTFLDGMVRREELSGCDYPTTVNRMELMAAIEGMTHLSRPHEVFLIADSSYLLTPLRTQSYRKWAANGETSRPNWDLWQRLVQLINYHDVKYVKVQGHVKEEARGDLDWGNFHADERANIARLDGKERWLQMQGVH